MGRAEKRRRSSSRCTRNSKNLATIKLMEQQKEQQQQQQQQRCSLDNLPPEVLEMVLQFLPYRDVAGNVRLVSKKCSSVAMTILNSGFLSAGSRLRGAMLRLEVATDRAADELDLALHGRAHNSLELVKAQYELLRAVVWRYTHPPRRQRFARLCFYGGAILDELDRLLGLARRCPAALLDKDGPAACVLGFGALCKKFMNYFEKVSERRVNRNTLVSGCKPVDVLDCLLEGREVLHCRVSTGRGGRPGNVSMRLRYVLERAWFTCLEVPGGGDGGVGGEADVENNWCDQQRFMYLRLRRLVGIVNEHRLERLHYERELLMQTSDVLPTPKPPPCSTYSGYGEYGSRFFYYGNMNEYAFDSKVIDTWRRNSARDRMRRRVPEPKPCYDLVINVELRCSPDLAPLAVRSMLKCDDFDNTTLSKSHRSEMYLKLSISCPASTSNKLPGHFVWELRSPRRCKSA